MYVHAVEERLESEFGPYSMRLAMNEGMQAVGRAGRLVDVEGGLCEAVIGRNRVRSNRMRR